MQWDVKLVSVRKNCAELVDDMDVVVTVLVIVGLFNIGLLIIIKIITT